MHHKALCTLTLSLLLLTASGCKTSPVATRTPLPATRLISASETPIPAEGLNKFSLALYQEVAREKPGNLAVSPLGSYILLGMLGAGAQGTALETIQAAGIPSIEPIAVLVQTLEAVPSLRLGQKIYLAMQAEISQPYLETVQPLLGEACENVPFQEDPRQATAMINGWVEAKTAGLIKNFLATLSSDTVCVLVSVLHFKGKWAIQFDPQATRAQEFTSADGQQLQVPMMQLKEQKLPVQKTSTGVLLALKYTDETECLLFLPNLGETPESVLPELPPGKLLENKKVTLELPRFEFGTETFQLDPAWRAAGLGPVLGNCDLSTMLPKEKPLSLQVFHKTYVKFDEEGTEAAAATAVVATRSMTAVADPPLHLKFDRPFFFLLRHSASGAIFMLGRVDRPEPWKAG